MTDQYDVEIFDACVKVIMHFLTDPNYKHRENFCLCKAQIINILNMRPQTKGRDVQVRIITRPCCKENSP